MSIRGVSFKIEQKVSCVLWDIFKCIDVKKYFWYNIEAQDEIWASNLKDDFFQENLYSGEDFLSKIQEDHFVIFLKLQAYYDSEPLYNISTYKAFQASECQLIFFVYDCEFVEIFSKNKIDIENLYNNAIKNRYKDVIYITDENDDRINMNVK